MLSKERHREVIIKLLFKECNCIGLLIIYIYAFIAVSFLSGTHFAQKNINSILGNILIFNFKNVYCIDR